MTADQCPPGVAAPAQRLRATSLPFKDRLADRTSDPTELFADDYDGTQPSEASLTSLLAFLEQPTGLGYPDPTLTPTGDCFVEWERDGRRMCVEFRDTGSARYMLTYPNARHPDQRDRLAIITTTDSVADTLAPLATLTGLAA